ncbi:1-deoxy-D-xylulose-5-phosphate synthase [Teredinibacter turnerae T7901]|uniref:1-deoxy-D-xylulose-5-phosphate synthase n=1 Tax=Teredinibacter turnerae (strain ATCC 39867 / T7901) TaxID=377629 RepID=C5BN60_TERTT|nr:1-deoxy-D-xylulose-5-phosphate synthase [Teredinibacter turnerae]ACR14422.1 1-deoxy-D-xylulose-5-phosphate synthase [Teredinibacter turnerae T7901]
MFYQIPNQRPATPLLDSIDTPADLRRLSAERLAQVAQELRAFLLYSVGHTGGHFGAGLGVVELTIALHYLLHTPEDRLIWDVGHQAYPHKILTGRREQLLTIRQQGGISGFPKRAESVFDSFGVGHSSTSLSAALGMALASAQQGIPRQCVAVIGDGAMTAGMAFEALNHAVHTQADLLVVLNDNTMSISPNVGGLASYFAGVLENSAEQAGAHAKAQVQSAPPASASSSASALFTELGFSYSGPIDGHDFDQLLPAISSVLNTSGPRLLHVVTRKGKGFAPAEKDPVGYHALNKIERESASVTPDKRRRYQQVFGDWLCDTAARDERLIGITPAMSEGSGMVSFAQTFSDRFHDVAIAEQHAITLAAGLACEGMKPVVAIYSTFLQRAYDQLIHDVALQDLDVLFAVDRAGLVGEDGASHAGSFDISFLRCIPNMVIATPSDERECYQLLDAAYQYPGPAAVRYPRGKGPGAELTDTLTPLEVGKAHQVREGEQLAILNFGALLPEALAVGDTLHATVCDMRWAKPLDHALLREIANSHRAIVTLEENAVAGGTGAGVLEWLQAEGITVPVLNLGLQDVFYEHGSRVQVLARAGLNTEEIEARIRNWLKRHD